jgi:hypothetical protein
LGDDVGGGGRVVDAGRHRPNGDVDELDDAEADILLHGAGVADGEAAGELPDDLFVVVAERRVDPEQRCVGTARTTRFGP